MSSHTTTDLLTATQAVKHMNRLGSGNMAGNGFCLWLRHDTPDGPRYSGGAWYSTGSRPEPEPEVAKVPVPWASMPSRRLTVADFEDAWWDQ